MPSATSEELAEAIIECVDAGAHVINLSVAISAFSSKGECRLEESLNYALRNSTMVVAGLTDE